MTIRLTYLEEVPPRQALEIIDSRTRIVSLEDPRLYDWIDDPTAKHNAMAQQLFFESPRQAIAAALGDWAAPVHELPPVPDPERPRNRHERRKQKAINRSRVPR